jgi:hypothetical protein
MLEALLKQCLAMPIHNSQSESKALLHSNSTGQNQLFKHHWQLTLEFDQLSWRQQSKPS